MQFLTKKHISRRTVLRGLGVTMALPVLDAMTPALTAQANAGKVRLAGLNVTQFGRDVVRPARPTHVYDR